MKFLLSIIIVTLLMGCGHSRYPVAQETLSVQERLYRLNSNDVIRITIFDEPELSGKYILDSAGQIALPLAGKITLAGKSEEEAAQFISQEMTRRGLLRQPKIAVQITQTRPVFVMGEVEHAGKYNFMNGMTVYQAIAQAGGYTYRGDRDDIILRRQTTAGPGTEKRYRAMEDTPVLPGDVIEVGERIF